MEPMPRIELPLWGNIILATLVGATLVWCFVDLYRSKKGK